jgi:DNA-directed RNA polymerase specialized sigma24 family protein
LEWLTKVAKHHNEWVKMVNQFGEYFFAEDIVQETYIMLMKWSSEEKLFKDGNISKGYMWLALKNTFLQHVNKNNKIKFIPLEDVYNLAEENNTEENEAYNDLLNNVDLECDSWHWYDKQLFELYKNTNKSLRQISAETNISVTSIFNTVKTCKKRIKNNVGEDYQDFINQDYELIKKKK